jgi:hypothetical protein
MRLDYVGWVRTGHGKALVRWPFLPCPRKTTGSSPHDTTARARSLTPCSTRQFTLIRCSKMVAYKKDRLEIDARSTVYVQCTFPATATRPNTCRWSLDLTINQTHRTSAVELTTAVCPHGSPVPPRAPPEHRKRPRCGCRVVSLTLPREKMRTAPSPSAWTRISCNTSGDFGILIY